MIDHLLNGLSMILLIIVVVLLCDNKNIYIVGNNITLYWVFIELKRQSKGLKWK